MSVAARTLTKKRFKDKDKSVFFSYYKLIFLLFFPADNYPVAAKSSDGFDFQICPFNEVLLKRYQKAVKREQTELKRCKNLLVSRTETGSLTNLHLEAVLNNKKGKLVIYHFRADVNTLKVSAFLFSKTNKLLWHSQEPVWETPSHWAGKEITFIKLIQLKDKIISYWLVDDLGIFAVTYPQFRFAQRLAIKITKPKDNPIISPRPENSWEAFTTFNPAAVYEAGKVHLLYRAQGFDYYSSLGYAQSSDGLTIDERLNKPIYQPRQNFEINTTGQVDYNYVSGGGYGGCEDPRLTKIDGRLYMTYVAFDGFNPSRIALTSISLKNFLARRWLWQRPVLISPPGVVDKSAGILPEKISGKYVIFHRIYPNILIDFVDTLKFDGHTFLKGKYKIRPRSRRFWDSRKIGIGAPPLKTKDGWLLIYQAVDDKDASHYQVGAMLLDLQDPTRVLCRSLKPIIKPDQVYEQNGFKAGVVYPCGAVIIENTLFVYYGAADTYVSVATANLSEFLQALKQSGLPQIYPVFLGQSK